VKNTLIIPEPIPDHGDDSSGGSFSWLTIFCLLLLSMRKITIRS